MTKYLFFLLAVMLFSCKTKQEKIIALLDSPYTTDVIEGSYQAAETRNPIYVPYLLRDAYNYNTSTSLKFQGYSIYRAKMESLEQILNVKAIKPISDNPDSTVIKFYTQIAISRNLLEK